MASSKAEFIAGGEVPPPALLSGSATVSSSSANPRPDAQTRKSHRSRTSTFFSNTLLRPRGKSVSHSLANDWGRPVGGSEGLGCIYNSTMDTRERSQVLRSVTHLTKDRSQDVSGAAAEAFSGNASPGLAQRTRFSFSFRAGSSTNVHEAPDAPPSYHQPEPRPELRRGSEGSVVSHISLPRQDGGGAGTASSTSSSRRSLSSSRPSYFSSGASSNASGSAISSGNTSVAASPGPRPGLGQQQKSHRRSSSQFSAAARQAFRTSRSFLGLPNNGISEDAEAIHTYLANASSDLNSNANTTSQGGKDNAIDKQRLSTSNDVAASQGSNEIKTTSMRMTGQTTRGMENDAEANDEQQPNFSITDANNAGGGGGGSRSDNIGPAGSPADDAAAAVSVSDPTRSEEAVALASNASSKGSFPCSLDGVGSSAEANGNGRPIGNENPTFLAGRREISSRGGSAVNEKEDHDDETRAESSASSSGKNLDSKNWKDKKAKSSKSQRVLGQPELELQHQHQPHQGSPSASSAVAAGLTASALSASAIPVSRQAASKDTALRPSAVPSAAAATAAASKDDAVTQFPLPRSSSSASASSSAARSTALLAPSCQIQPQLEPVPSSQFLLSSESPSQDPSPGPSHLNQQQQQQQQQLVQLMPSSLHSHVSPSLSMPLSSFSVPAYYSTAASTPLSSTLTFAVIASDTSSSTPTSSPSVYHSPSISRTPSHLDPGVAAPSSPFTSSTTTATSTAATTTAATTPSQSTSKLAHVLSPDSSSSPSTSSPSSATVSTNSQHAASLSPVHLNNHQPAKQQRQVVECHPSAPASASHDDRSALPLTPPGSSGPCLSPRSSVSGASGPRASVDAITRSRHGIPSPPASTAHGSASGSNSRRGSSNDPLVSPVSILSPRSSIASPGPNSQALEPTASSSGTGRVSFDLRRISLFGGTSSAGKMSSNGPRASFAGLGNGQPPNAAEANGARHVSSPSSGSASKFFSRISFTGSSRRGSAANESPLSSPEAKPRSRFASFGRLSRGNDAQTSPNGTRGLRNSMQPWASASTDVLAAQGRNSLTLAREEATRPRKSLHLPRTNLIDLDAEEASDTAASTSTATHDFDSRLQPPIAPTVIKPEITKPVSPSLNSARRPSFNFLRRASATSTNSNTDNANGERRGSFARNFMNRTLSRNSKNDIQQQEATARAVQTPQGEADTPIFRNGIFDSQTPAFTGSVAYPGMSSTVNWNAPSNARSVNTADIGPGEVDPTAVVPAYPGSAAASVAPVQPKNVAELTSGVVAQRRPSQGIDQEQDAVEAGDTVPDTLVANGPSTTAATVLSSTDSTASRQRPTRSSNALSHLPRLNSMRTVGGASNSSHGNINDARIARTGSESTNGATEGETSEDEQEFSEGEDDPDMTGQTSDYHDLETETEDETDDDRSPVVSRRVSAAPMTATGSSGGLNRNRPTESLVLPPAPSFIPNPTSSLATQGDTAGASASSSGSANNGAFSQTVGRDSWTSFNASGFTPFETPTPSFGGGSFNSAFSGPTPRARQELSESSYFAARPGTSNSGRATTAGTMSGDAPPPSPSIISRSRAPSSASMRTLRTPGAASISSGPVPNRSMPAPVGALPPLALNRQISAASGLTARSGIVRSKSPGLAPASSRPSTSGTLTPHQAPAGERVSSREPSIDRPASERPASRQEDAKSTSTAPTPSTSKTTVRHIVGLDGASTSSARPNFYQQKSKSLVDLLGPASRRLEIDTAQPSRPVINEPSGIEALRTPTTPRPISEVPAYSKKDGLAPINTGLTAPASIASPGGMSLGRRRSMFEMRAEPPPYSIIHNRPEGPQIILPREEEGKEKLPNYCCGVHIEGYLPRKMEFSAPGVQAKDRSWRRQYFVLHGTSLRVYKNDLSVDRHAATGSWGEMKGVHVHLEPMNEDGSNGSGSGIGLGAAAREAISHTPLGGSRHDASKRQEAGTQFDAKNGLVRNYTLQGAESGLAADYLKRRHVVRVRAEGEQFLLQTRSDRHVVDWIEALQAATNVSMDLEKRPMPKFITLPRRRRRRRRNADGTTISPEEQEARDLAEAQRRSMAEAGGGRATGAEATPRTSMSQGGRPSMSIENELNPSAAFERMLREDQEEGGRQTAAVM
ncbi:uncharacterized protein UTRI_04032 [Ustilago trichophora]|uniref:PH domain-containing protein n=1 Tax=Ustilago trichophora TaxID=86804 RepID=A0A5C3E6W5_9BASI|nr:uncharacterized protein UTRI_04032 [Ustilago trichophora]